jgi:hypothetical protein
MIYLWFPIVCMLFHDYMSVTSVGESFVMGYGQYGTSIFCLPAEEREYFFRGTGVESGSRFIDNGQWFANH